MFYTIIGIYQPPYAKTEFLKQFKALQWECNFDKEVINLGDFNIAFHNAFLIYKIPNDLAPFTTVIFH